MKYLLVLPLAFFAVPALAQQQPQPPAKEQALSGKLMDEINQNIEYRRALIEAIAQINDMKKQLTDAQEKAAKADAAPKSPAAP